MTCKCTKYERAQTEINVFGCRRGLRASFSRAVTAPSRIGASANGRSSIAINRNRPPSIISRDRARPRVIIQIVDFINASCTYNVNAAARREEHLCVLANVHTRVRVCTYACTYTRVYVHINIYRRALAVIPPARIYTSPPVSYCLFAADA